MRLRSNRCRAGSLAAVGWLVATVAVAAFTLPGTAAATTSYLRIPERVGDYAVDREEHWGYTSGTSSLGGTVSPGARSDTRKVTRTFTYRIKGSKLGLKMDISTLNTVRYEVYVSGPNKGKVYRFYAPTVVGKGGTASYLLIWKLTPKLVNTVLSVEPAGSGYRYRIRHDLSFTFPRQITIGRDQLSELVRRVFRLSFESYDRIINLVPDGGYGYLRVGLPS